MKSGYQIVTLANGGTSVHSSQYGETFHPVIGPVAEAEALYVNQLRLRERLENFHGEFVIWDIGLGAAANALTVLRTTRDLPCAIRLISFDQTAKALEFAAQNAAALGYFGGYEVHVQELLRNQRVKFHEGKQSVDWQLHVADFPSFVVDGAGEIPVPHAVLFDPYSPGKNPEMWTLTLLTNLFRRLDPQRPCSLATYSRATMLRAALLLAGFFVGVGHATGKKEETTVAANTLDLIPEPLDLKWLDRARRSHSAEPLHEAVYRQAPLSKESWEKLQAHPQFNPPDKPPSPGCSED